MGSGLQPRQGDQGGNTCSQTWRMPGFVGSWPFRVSVSVGSQDLQVCKEAACSSCGGLGTNNPHPRKHILTGGQCQVLRPIVPASGLQDLGGGPGKAAILPLPRKRLSFVNTETTIPSIKIRKNQQGGRTCCGK
ncbi:Hypothetical predicted protein [Marmota monax]|uniref:Uncharacterized protein n=1 Tax=Marmota monax TaxID=9995 RepID=A0A5E4AIH3_MARMO|nr:hypothetical protein GHT09_018813 [Marmota monax]VTJ56750.1 Hypothetical predicted protein [Marmota monax]